MAMINEPLTDCTIIFKYLHWTPDRRGNRYYHDRFSTIPQLRDYFKRFPDAGALVGYGNKPRGTSFAFEASLLIEWTDMIGHVTKEFSDAHEFIRFLKENPALAKWLKYEPR